MDGDIQIHLEFGCHAFRTGAVAAVLVDSLQDLLRMSLFQHSLGLSTDLTIEHSPASVLLACSPYYDHCNGKVSCTSSRC
jgi:hypothetical protein